MQLLQADGNLLKVGTLLYFLQPTKLQFSLGGEVRGTGWQSKALLSGENVPEPLLPSHKLGARCSIRAWIFIHSLNEY